MRHVQTAVLVLALAAPAFAETTLAPGNPPLTDEMVGRYCEFFEWAFDVQLTSEQRQKLEDHLVDTWKKHDQKEMKDAQDTLKNQSDLAQMNKGERDMMRAQLEGSILADMRRHPDETSKWALAVYENAHKAIAPGKPALTRQVADAYAELTAFMISEAAGEPYTPDKAFKDAIAKSLAAEWKSLKPDQKEELEKVPQYWAAVRVTWPTVAETEKAKFRKAWGDELKQYAPKDLGETQAAVAKNQGQVKLAGGHEGVEEQKRAWKWAHNMMTMPHVADMNVISNVANSGWHYEYKYW